MLTTGCMCQSALQRLRNLYLLNMQQGREAMRRVVAVSVPPPFPRAEHLLRPGDQQRGSKQRGQVSKHGGGTPRKREKVSALVFSGVLPPSEHTFNWSFLLRMVLHAFHIQYPPHIYLFIFSSLLQWLKKDIWIFSLRGSKSPFWREPKYIALKRPRLPRWNCLYSAASGSSPKIFCGMEWRINEIAMTAVLQCASITARLRLESIICMYLGVSIKGWQRGPQSSVHPKVFGMMEVQLLLLWGRQLECQCVASTCTIHFSEHSL